MRHSQRDQPATCVVRWSLGAAVATIGLAGASAASASTASRPAAENVPATVHHARLADTSAYSTSHVDRTVTVRGTKAARLVMLFDELKPEPRGTAHCMVAGGPQTTVTFQGAGHTWVARQSSCTNITVTRDGRSLPTLLPSKAWMAEVDRDLGR